jgi:hypothetical protein
MRVQDTIQPVSRRDRATDVTLIVAGIALVTAIATGWIIVPLALVPIAVVLGWSHLSSI